jgi:predicted metal-binding membrane protein
MVSSRISISATKDAWTNRFRHMLRALLQHDRTVVLACLVAVILLAWGWLLIGAGIEMEQMDMGGGQVMLMAPEWSPGYAALIFLMWAIMMVAMMLPSAAPAILLAAALMRQRGGNRIFGPTGVFALGYLVIWFGFSLIATALQWGLDRVGLLSAGMASGNATLAGVLLIVAGLYQWTPLKQSCLGACRSPFQQLAKYWRYGTFGPILAGARHGFLCLGCCWMLMAVLFVGGLMNVLWIAALAFLVLIEKLLSVGPRVSRLTGMAFLVWGAIVLCGY